MCRNLSLEHVDTWAQEGEEKCDSHGCAQSLQVCSRTRQGRRTGKGGKGQSEEACGLKSREGDRYVAPRPANMRQISILHV
mmetsp:Transcript_70007/g.152745  ORF Transcript_70007/g.152745 Transcript_70007/m.152745 type:complete len:81 (-) Transcript_70007:19-261(-)